MKYIRILLAITLLYTVASAAIGSPESEMASDANESAGEADPIFSYDEPIALAEGYLLSCQNSDGGFGADPDSASDIKDTSLAVIALARSGKNISSFALNGTDSVHYLLENQKELNNSSNYEALVGIYVVALASSGLDPRDTDGRDYVQILKSFIHSDGDIGKENYIWDDAWVIMALAACNESRSNEVKGSIEHLAHIQTAKGGWAWNGAAKDEDADTSSIVLCALLSGGEDCDSDAVKRGLEYLLSEQNADGGFSSMGSNAATDAWAIMAIEAAGQNPEEWMAGTADPIQHLLSLQQEDGSVWWKSDSEGMSFEYTANAILALTGGVVPPSIYSNFR